MSSTIRRFGTDVSNIPADILHKTPSKKIASKSQSSSTRTKRAPSVPKELKSSPLFDVMESLMDTINISIDDEISVKSPVRLAIPITDEFRYDRDFLMQFKDSCVEPIDGLLPEVIPGFVHPESRIDQPTSSKGPSSISLTRKHSKVSSSVDRSESSLSTSEPISQAPSTSSEIGSVNPKEWRVKPARKQKPREEDQRRLAARQKQINIGMNTIGYKRFIELSASARSSSDPKIPDIYQVCSKRSWDGQVKKWRKGLHRFDPTPESAGEQFDEQNAADQHANSDPSLDDDSSDDDDGLDA